MHEMCSHDTLLHAQEVYLQISQAYQLMPSQEAVPAAAFLEAPPLSLPNSYDQGACPALYPALLLVAGNSYFFSAFISAHGLLTHVHICLHSILFVVV